MTAGVCFAYVYGYRFGFLQTEFQICLHCCVSFLGKKKWLRDLGGQIYKVELTITIDEACLSLPLPSPSLFPPCPHFVYCGFICSALKLEGNWFLQMLRQGHISSFTSRCSFNPISSALCHSARADLMGADWNNTKDRT